MQVSIKDVGEIVIIELKGNIRTHEDYSVFKNAINDVIELGKVKIILNFKEVHFINSSGLGRLILMARKVKENSGALIVTNLSDNLRELFSFTRLDNKIKTHLTEEDALESFE